MDKTSKKKEGIARLMELAGTKKQGSPQPARYRCCQAFAG